MNETLKKAEDKMKKAVEALDHNFRSIRAGRATPAVLEKITVDYYGVPTKIDQMAAISIPEPRMLVIQPWDISSVSSIEKAILASDLGITPNSDGKVLRIGFPPPTQERRRELVKEVSRHSEEGKVAVRAVRRDTNEKLKALKKDSTITEDDLKNAEEKTQKLTDKYCKEIDDLAKAKEAEIMEI